MKKGGVTVELRDGVIVVWLLRGCGGPRTFVLTIKESFSLLNRLNVILKKTGVAGVEAGE